MDNSHSMETRSKSKNKESKNTQPSPIIEDDDVDEYGNIKGLIDYDSKEDENAMEELNKQLFIISNGSSYYNGSAPRKSKPRKKKDYKKNDSKLNDIFMNYLILKATDKANNVLKNKKRKKNKKIEEEKEDKINETIEVILNYEDDFENEEEEFENEEEEFENEEEEFENEEEEFEDCKEIETEISDSDSESDSEFEFDLDELDEKYNELIDKHSSINTEENDIEYFHHLDTQKKEQLIMDMKTIYEMNESNTPLRFKIIDSEMDIKTKAVAISNIDKLADMDISTGEYSKLDNWINGLIKIPFGKYQKLPVLPESSNEEKRNFIQTTHEKLDTAIYGHKEAKTHILQVIGKWIKNPDSGGNVLAIQGPMGNGKTTLVKEGISKVLNRPFAFIALGGASDSSFFDGHSYTYEGSHWGRIVQILHDSKCMNPIIYFDELDKVSDTSKGDEIIHMLTHLTDPSQNSLFQDNYFPGINLDLSKALFIFSYNDETRVNKILRDRMYVIHTKGFKTEDKLKISRDYLLPEIMNTFGFVRDEIIFTDEILKEIIEKYTQGEEGVRNLKRCIETLISKINIYMLSYSEEDKKSIQNLSFQLNKFHLPLELTSEHIHDLLIVNQSDKPPEHMYM